MSESSNAHKLSLEKESFFDIGIIPKNSDYWELLKNAGGRMKDVINFKDVLLQETDDLLRAKSKSFYEYVMGKYR